VPLATAFYYISFHSPYLQPNIILFWVPFAIQMAFYT
jgi:hypothetical protein